jgi:macrolide transport system ATP-binding/permease protein
VIYLLLRCIDIEKSFGDLSILKGVSLEIRRGEKIGLVGSNGAGKSTLANIISQEIEADAGKILPYDEDIRIGYLRQAAPYSLNSLNRALAQGKADLLETASQMGLSRVTHWDEERFQALSGGEKTKLALAGVLSSRPDLLILDEPTNHMDIHGVEWLAAEMKKNKGAALIISHDRWFLDQAVTRIYELEWGKAKEYPGNNSFYQQEKQRQFASQLHHYQSEQREQRQIEGEITRLKQWSAKAHQEAGKTDGHLKEYGRKKAKLRDQQIKSRIKMLERKRTEGTERPREESRPQFEFEAAGKRGRRIIEATGLSKGYGQRTLFTDSDFFIRRGEKLGLIGPNGCGKTTLIRIILGQEKQDGGELWRSPSLKPGFLSQEITDIDTEKNALEIMGVSQKDEVTQVRTMLANMGFDAAMVAKPVAKLSLGEGTRLKLAAMIIQQHDLLILDEPTNHLDLHSREELEATLLGYDGTIIIASHDRYLLERVCDKLLVFADRTITKLAYGFREYKQKAEETGAGLKAKTDKENLLVIETRMAWVINELGKYTPEDEQYVELDQEFQRLVEKKRELSQ